MSGIIAGIVAILAAIGGAFVAGKRNQKKNERVEIAERREEAIQTRKEIDDEISDISDPDLVGRADKWVRPRRD